jgi:hypothetical protein
MMKQLMENKVEGTIESKKNEVVDDDFIEEVDIIHPNAYMRVTSLCQGNLYLTTGEYGTGQLMEFSKFGQTRTMTYDTLEKIVNSNRVMAEKGRYYIQSKKAVRQLMLEDVYEDILNVEAIEALVNGKEPNMIEIFKLAKKAQQEQIVDMIIKNVLNGAPVDYNQLNKISDIYGKDIITKIKDAEENKKNMTKK